MNNKYFENWMNKIRGLGVKPGLIRVKKLLSLMDNPQNKLDIIHITGTNGKGSTATVLSNILIEGNYSVGQFSTPSILGFNHMFRVNNNSITNEELFDITDIIKDNIESMIKEGYDHPTEYEIISCIMYEYFYRKHVDFAVVEVAMGGENDCTNVMDYSIISIITEISLDHSSFLGNNLKDIAIEKSGVIKNNSVVISHKQTKEVMDVLEKKSTDMMSVLKVVENIENYEVNEEFISFEYKKIKIKSKLIGRHQGTNISGVIECISNLKNRGYINITSEELLTGISKSSFEGRFEYLKKDPIWIIDGAHNSKSINGLRDSLIDLNYSNLIGILGILKDKDMDESLKSILPLFKKIILTEPDSFRKLSVNELKKKIQNLSNIEIVDFKEVTDAIEYVKKNSLETDVIVGFGSFYMISDIRKNLYN